MTPKHFLAGVGFAFVAAWIGFNFGYALLCLAGAAVFYAAGAVVEGEIDLGALQRRLRKDDDASGAPAASYEPPPRVR